MIDLLWFIRQAGGLVFWWEIPCDCAECSGAPGGSSGVMSALGGGGD